jgi:hypothetical protein
MSEILHRTNGGVHFQHWAAADPFRSIAASLGDSTYRIYAMTGRSRSRVRPGYGVCVVRNRGSIVSRVKSRPAAPPTANFADTAMRSSETHSERS